MLYFILAFYFYLFAHNKHNGHGYGRRKDFCQRVPREDFSKNFLGGPKVVKFVFSHSKVRKQPLFATVAASGPTKGCVNM